MGLLRVPKNDLTLGSMSRSESVCGGLRCKFSFINFLRMIFVLCFAGQNMNRSTFTHLMMNSTFRHLARTVGGSILPPPPPPPLNVLRGSINLSGEGYKLTHAASLSSRGQLRKLFRFLELCQSYSYQNQIRQNVGSDLGINCL